MCLIMGHCKSAGSRSEFDCVGDSLSRATFVASVLFHCANHKFVNQRLLIAAHCSLSALPITLTEESEESGEKSVSRRAEASIVTELRKSQKRPGGEP
jgi:hypothetical protein